MTLEEQRVNEEEGKAQIQGISLRTGLLEGASLAKEMWKVDLRGQEKTRETRVTKAKERTVS